MSVRRGFTIMEILVVVAVIILILSILVVALGQASRTSQAANTRVLLTSLKQGLVRFREDIGYQPPVLGEPGAPQGAALRSLWSPPDPDAPSYRNDVPHWSSVTTLAEYLIGWDHHQHDGYGVATYGPGTGTWGEESPPVGIRSPGADGVWGATVQGDGELAARMQGLGDSIDKGRVYGPYVELKDERLLGSVSGDRNPDGSLRVFFAGEAGYDAADPRVIVDYWGSPIRYFRRAYPAGALKQSYRAHDRTGDGVADRVPTLSDAFVLRPWEIGEGTDVDGLLDFSSRQDQPAGDPSTTMALNSAEFALLSPGPDRRFEPTMRVDPDEFNKDNVVEAGP